MFMNVSKGCISRVTPRLLHDDVNEVDWIPSKGETDDSQQCATDGVRAHCRCCAHPHSSYISRLTTRPDQHHDLAGVQNEPVAADAEPATGQDILPAGDALAKQAYARQP